MAPSSFLGARQISETRPPEQIKQDIDEFYAALAKLGSTEDVSQDLAETFWYGKHRSDRRSSRSCCCRAYALS